MSQLSAQTIRKLCVNLTRTRNLTDPKTGDLVPLIDPFIPEKRVVNGTSYGLSACSYDVRIAHGLTLGPHPGFALLEALKAGENARVEGDEPRECADYRGFSATLWGRVMDAPSPIALAHTIEDFALPLNVSGQVLDKSTYARLHVSAFNTLLDPGWRGNLTLELVNLSPSTIVLKGGDPICQIVFQFLDEPTERPYRGKYQGQGKEAVGAIMEQDHA